MRRFMRIFLRTAFVILTIAFAFGLIRYHSLVFTLVSTFTRRVGSIDFFGTSGVDVEAVRAKLPLKVGYFSAKFKSGGPRRVAFEQATGHSPVNVFVVCCNESGREYAFIGLGGNDVPAAQPPTGAERLSKPLLDLYNEFLFALVASIMRGNSQEDHSTGYALSRDPALRAVQLRMREAALKNEQELLTVTANSSDVNSRRAAAHLLGYAEHSKRQAEALANASRDADENVRNNATRALGVLMEAFPETGKEIDLDYFLDLMNSRVWTDRNKASMLLEEVSRSRDKSILARMRAKDLDSLIEMARWKAPHRQPAVMILGRIAGVDESSLMEKVQRGLFDDIIAAVH